MDYYWDGKIDYLKKSTSLFYNDDYIEFLVRTVWKIDQPIRVIDFGCGYGHLGLRLLPLLPEGSTYTGVDAGVKLIEHARDLFRELPYEADFIVSDIHEISFERNYDLAVCHAVLLHMQRPKDMLKKMIDCVTDHGRIVCFEPNWIVNMASFYYEGIEQSSVISLGLLQKLYEMEASRTGKDGNIGLKLPVYFRQLGLTNIECRVSDKVNFHDPAADSELASSLYKLLQFEAPTDREPFIQNLVQRGLFVEEAEQQYEAELNLSRKVTDTTAFTYAPTMKITFGTVMR